MKSRYILSAAILCAASAIAYSQSSLTSGEEVVQPGKHTEKNEVKPGKKRATVNRYDAGKGAINPAYPASAPREKREKTYHTEEYKGFKIKVADDEPLHKQTPADLPATNAQPASNPVSAPIISTHTAPVPASTEAPAEAPAMNFVAPAYTDSVLRAADFPLYLKAAEQGDPESMRRLGLCYIYGTGTERDTKTGLKWLGKAAMHENTEAQYDIGVVFRDGYGVRPNPADASFWFRKAARNGNAKAQLAAGLLFLEGRGVQQDSRIAAENFWRAAEQGNVDAAYRLACMYRDGVGMERNPAKAYHYFTVAASKGEYKDAGRQAQALKQYARSPRKGKAKTPASGHSKSAARKSGERSR